MTALGLRNLFPAGMEEVRQSVPHYMRPLWAAQNFFSLWADFLSKKTKAQFLDMRVRDFIAATPSDYDRPFVSELNDFATVVLAYGTAIYLRKPRQIS